MVFSTTATKHYTFEYDIIQDLHKNWSIVFNCYVLQLELTNFV